MSNEQSIQEEIARALIDVALENNWFDVVVAEDIAAALSPLLNRVRAEAEARILRTLLDGVILSWHSRGGLTVWESEEHYNAGTPKPLMIHEWLENRADRIEQNSEGS